MTCSDFLNASSFAAVPDFCLHVNVLACVGKVICVLLQRGGFTGLSLQDCVDERRRVPCSFPLIERKRHIRIW